MKTIFFTPLVSALIVLSSNTNGAGMPAWDAQLESLMTSFKVANKQEVYSKEKVGTARTAAAQASSSAAIELRTKESVREIVENFGPDSQLIDPCYQVGMATTAADTKGKTDDNAQRAIARIYSTADNGTTSLGGISGVFGGTKKVSSYTYGSDVATRTNRHLNRYCSVSESLAGYCILNANGMQGADSDFSVHFAPGKTFGWDQTEAATDFIKTIAPVRAIPKSKGCSTPDCLSLLAERRKQEAYMSMSRYSMVRFVESRSTQSAGDAKKALGNH